MSTDNVSVLALQIENNQFNAGLRHSQALMQGLGNESLTLTSVLRQTGMAMAGLVVGSKMVRGLTSTIMAASAAREDLAQFDHVMRNTTKTAGEMVKALTSDSFGRTNVQARQMLMGMTSLAKGMGMTDKAAVQLSGEFSKMAVDIGSFMMRDPEAIMGAFQSALMGNTMALRSYGVFLNETLLKETVAANAKKGMVFASERQARAYAVLTEAQKQQADAIGDYAVEAANFGNQIRKFYAGLSEIPEKFGASFLASANEFLKVANSMIDKLRGLDEQTWKTIATVTALGTGATLLAAGYKIIQKGVLFYRAAQIAAIRTTTENAAAITAETAALHANTAARTANAASGTLASAAVRRLPSAVSSRRTPLPHQDRRDVWEAQVAGLRQQHSRAVNEIAVAEAARRAVAFRRVGVAPGSAEAAMYDRLALAADNRIQTGTRRRNNLERNMQSLRDAQRRNPLNLTDRQRAERRAVMRQNVSRGRYDRAVRTFGRRTRGIRRSPLGMVSRGVGGTASAVGQATGITWLLKSFGSMVMKWLPASAKLWGATALRSVATALLPLAGTALAILNPIGWAATILAGIAAVGNYLPTLMYKAYDGFVSLFSTENLSNLWERFSSMAVTCFEKTIEFLGKGIYGIGLVFENVFYTAINALGNGLRAIIKATTLGAVDIGEFAYKSSGYVAYEQQKKVNEMQARLDEQKEEQAKREKQIAEFRSKVSEQERDWLTREEEIVKKRNELAAGRLDSVAKAESTRSNLQFAEALVSSIDSALNAVKARMEEAKREFENATQSGDEDKQSVAREKYDTAVARMNELQKQKSSNTAGVAEMRYSLFDLSLENAAKPDSGTQKSFHDRMGAYKSLMQDVQGSFSRAQTEQTETEYDAARRSLAEKQREYHSALTTGDDIRAAALKEEIESAEKRIAKAQAAYNELQANLSDSRRLQEKMDALAEEQNRRHKEAQSNLWNFNYEHASSSVGQQMARKSFFEAQNRFEGAQSDDERDKALQDMQSMYGKIDTRAAEMPTWNGFLQTTSGAIESNSAAAQDLQERVLTDFNKTLLDNTIQQTVIMKAMEAALELVAKHTDPNQQPSVGGTIT
jgi:hypothetical protein